MRNNNKLKEFRKKAQMTQQEVANYLGIVQPQYNKHENSKSYLNSKQILQLCELFNCTPNDLLGFKGVHTVVVGKLEEEI